MDKILHHINRHHKKYIFAAGTAVGLTIVKIVAIVAVFFGITIFTGKSEAKDQRLEMCEAINLFYKIDTIAHQEIKESADYGNPFDEERIKEFEEIDDIFHEADNLNERYKAAKQIVNFLTEQEKTRPHPANDPDVDRDQEFEQLLQQFNQIQ